MTRQQYDELSAPLLQVMSDMEDEFLNGIAAQLVQGGDISDTSNWRTRQYAATEQLNERTSALVSSYSEAQTGHMRSAIETAMLQEVGYVDSAVQSAVSKGLFSGSAKSSSAALVNNTAAEFEDRIQNDLNVVNNVMRNKARDAYMMGINDMYNQINANGELSLQEASRATIKKLAQKGIPGYIDKRSGEWSPDSYMTLDMRAALGSATRAAQNARCDEYGIKLIQVSSHLGARPLCAPYQGRIFSRDGSSGVTTDGAGGKIEYTPLSETSYGDPAGLFGVNCGHVQLPFIPGVDMQQFFPYPKDENDEYYQKLQRQRNLERQIKASKRECMMFDATGDKEELARSSLKLRNQQEQYANYCKAVGLSRNDERTQVLGYDKSVSSRTSGAAQKALDKSGESGIIESITRNNMINSHDDSFSSNGIWDTIKSAFGKSTQSDIPSSEELVETLKSIGFTSVDKSFFKNIDKDLQVSIVDQLKKLEDKFGVIRISFSPTISANNSGSAFAHVRHNKYNPARQDLHFSKNKLRNKQEYIEHRKKRVKSFHYMPCAIDDETLSRYTVTHEYGHMLENILAQNEMANQSVSFEDITKRFRNEITDIAKLYDREYNDSKYLSKRGQKNDREFFAECFANSQLGEPNTLGYAMSIWLERRRK